jgi:hypothetical protein
VTGLGIDNLPSSLPEKTRYCPDEIDESGRRSSLPYIAALRFRGPLAIENSMSNQPNSTGRFASTVLRPTPGNRDYMLGQGNIVGVKKKRQLG